MSGSQKKLKNNIEIEFIIADKKNGNINVFLTRDGKLGIYQEGKPLILKTIWNWYNENGEKEP